FIRVLIIVGFLDSRDDARAARPRLQSALHEWLGSITQARRSLRAESHQIGIDVLDRQPRNASRIALHPSRAVGQAHVLAAGSDALTQPVENAVNRAVVLLRSLGHVVRG